MSGILKKPIMLALLLAAFAQVKAQVPGTAPVQSKPLQPVRQQPVVHKSYGYYKQLMESRYPRSKASGFSTQASISDAQRMQRLRNYATAREEMLKENPQMRQAVVTKPAPRTVSYGENVKRLNMMHAQLVKDTRKQMEATQIELRDLQKRNIQVQRPGQQYPSAVQKSTLPVQQNPTIQQQSVRPGQPIQQPPVQVQQQPQIQTSQSQAPVQQAPKPIRKARVTTPAGKP